VNLVTLVRLPLSAQEGWPELACARFRLLRLFLAVVLPLSLVPPVVLYVAGTHDPGLFGDRLAERAWGGFAVAFFAAEMATLLGMSWLLRQVALTRRLSLGCRDAFLLAAVAPIPMWLSALGLLAPSLAVAALVAAVGLALTCAIVHNGLLALGRARDPVEAAGAAHVVIGAALGGWACLLAFALV